MGTLGLAWTGDLKNAGGVCEKNGVSTILSVVYCLEQNFNLKIIMIKFVLALPG